MSEELQTPEVAPTPESTDNLESLIAPLMATKSWVRFISILGFIGCAFIVLGAIAMMKMSSGMGHSQYGQVGQAASGVSSVVSIFYVIIGILYFIPSYFLFKYASAIATATLSRTLSDITIALNYQKSFWKFAGILTLVTFVLGILGAILVPILMMSGIH